MDDKGFMDKADMDDWRDTRRCPACRSTETSMSHEVNSDDEGYCSRECWCAACDATWLITYVAWWGLVALRHGEEA